MLRADAARVVENVAASIADGAHVDWEQADANVSGRELRLVQHLRVIDSLAGVYRTLPSLVEDEAGPGTRPDYPEGPRWGRLILLDRIGSGSSADVYRAWDAELQREVALKLLRDEGVSGSAPANARLLQEARRLARIRHPHVVHVYGAERHEERIGLWMELVRGRSIDEVVRQDGPIDVAEAAHVGIDLCSALAAVHGAGLLHRDVKAQNVIREDSGRLVLMDFGTGEEIEDQTPRLAGTPIYLSPEVISRGPASVQSDLYAVGVLLFYAVTGEFPVVGDSLDGARPGASGRPVSRRSRRPARDSGSDGARGRSRARAGSTPPLRERVGDGGCAAAGRERAARPARSRHCAVGARRDDDGGNRRAGRHADRDAPGGSAVLDDQHTCRAATSLCVRGSGRAVPGGRTHRSTHHDAGADSLAQGDRPDVGCAVQGDRRSGRRDCPPAWRGWHRRRDGARAEGNGQSTGAGARQRPIDQGGLGPGHLVGFAGASTGRHARTRVGAGQDDRSSDAWRADAGRECEPARLTEDRSRSRTGVPSRDERISLCSRRTRNTRWRRSSGRSPSILFTERRTPALPGATWRWALLA